MERLQSSDYVIKVAKNEAVKCGARVKGVTTLYATARDGAPSASDCLPHRLYCTRPPGTALRVPLIASLIGSTVRDRPGPRSECLCSAPDRL